MSAGTGYPGRFEPRKQVGLPGRFSVLLNEEEAEVLLLNLTAALREWDEERAQTLFGIVEAEVATSQPPDGVA